MLIKLFIDRASIRDNIGTSIEIKSEKLSNNFWAISGTMASFYELLKVLSDWLIKRGLKKSDAQRYVISLYSALAQLAEVHSSKNLRKFVLESKTPGGLNWQVVNELRKSGYFKYLEKVIKQQNRKLDDVDFSELNEIWEQGKKILK